MQLSKLQKFAEHSFRFLIEKERLSDDVDVVSTRDVAEAARSNLSFPRLSCISLLRHQTAQLNRIKAYSPESIATNRCEAKEMAEIKRVNCSEVFTSRRDHTLTIGSLI